MLLTQSRVSRLPRVWREGEQVQVHGRRLVDGVEPAAGVASKCQLDIS